MHSFSSIASTFAPMMQKKYCIGRSDFADFPMLDIEDIAVKIDTGAYTSAIHCKKIEVVDEKLHFVLLDPEHDQFHNREFVVQNYTYKSIKNSFGIAEQRYVIETSIKLFGELYSIELSLSNREQMKFPVLLGRKLLEQFIVDVSKTNLSKKLKDENSSFIKK